MKTPEEFLASAGFVGEFATRGQMHDAMRAYALHTLHALNALSESWPGDNATHLMWLRGQDAILSALVPQSLESPERK